jgi:metal-responsive CopG/Arc/MetJ family transcriptional regulator
MSVAKIAITLDETLLRKVDRMVQGKVYPNRSKAIQWAVEEQIQRYDHGRLARECAKLDPVQERGIAEEGISMEAEQWPHY